MHLVDGVVLVVVGLSFVAFGIVGGAQGRRRTATTTGVVVDQRQRAERSGAPVTYPVVKVELPGVGERTIIGSTGRTPPAHKLGDTVKVSYDPRNPDAATVGSTGAVLAIFVALGIVVLIIGALVLAL